MAESHERRLLFVVHSLHVGGIEVLISRWAQHWVNRGWDVHVATFLSGGVLEEVVRTHGGIVHALNKREGLDVGLATRLKALTKRLGTGVVHTNNYSPWIYAGLAAIGSRWRLVHTEHSLVEGSHRRRLIAERVLSMCTDAVVAVSDDVRNQMIANAGIRPSRIAMIANGVDTEVFKPSPQLRQSVRVMLGIPGDAQVIGTVGRMVSVKDQATLIRACAMLVAVGLHPWLLLVGDGPLRGELEELARDLGVAERTVFAGQRDQVSGLLAAMDVFALPSLSEGMSVSMLEAMSSALPIVATDVGGNPQLIRARDTGLLFPSADPNALAAALREILEDAELRDRLGNAARQHCCGHYSFDSDDGCIRKTVCR